MITPFQPHLYWGLTKLWGSAILKPIMIPLKEAHLKFIEHLKDKNRSNSTVLAYGKDIDQLVEFLEELRRARVTDVSQPDVEAFLAKLLKNGYTPKSVS